MDPKQARSALLQFALWGVAISLVGIVIAGTTRPHVDELGLYSGDEAGFWFGMVIAWIGNLLLLVAVVGWGVKLGREAWPTRQQEMSALDA